MLLNLVSNGVIISFVLRECDPYNVGIIPNMGSKLRIYVSYAMNSLKLVFDF
jgi:hypothetical protein